MATQPSPALRKARQQNATLQARIDEHRDMIRNGVASLTAARAERDRALSDMGKASTTLAAVSAENARQRQHIRRLFNSIFHLNLELARRNGYIERVKERDNGVSVTGPGDVSMGDSIDDLRRDLAGARSEHKIGGILDGMDPDILDQVLGRDPEADPYIDLARG